MVKQAQSIVSPALAVRTRRAYFDCRFGQLHVRTAFPTTGGFNEQQTLFCLHPREGGSRSFSRFLPEVADLRSAYAPDLPGFGESDSSPGQTIAEAASAVADLAHDLRLRQIDVLGLQYGALVALELAAAQAELVRRLVLVGIPGAQPLPAVKQKSLLLRTQLDAQDTLPHARAAIPNAQFVEAAEYASDLFDAAPKTLAKQISEFLSARV